ncbi:hypothetical protein [Paenibacillus sp. OV219]|nr:hypothetical protein [Paenibacillus sp. OV219]SEO20345.1 hypothetical protein SAMN05518847_106245 [Paenibacillus sp. OV219]
MAKNKNNKMNAAQTKYNAEFASENAAGATSVTTKGASQKAEK